jgi:hypothetical protein
VPLSYSAQVAEQFSSSYRQTPSQERGRLDAARLAQFNQQQQTAGAPSGSTGALLDGQSRPVRPSEMKDEGCVLSSTLLFFVLYPSSSPCLVYVKRRKGWGWSVVCPPTLVGCSDSHNSSEKTVRQLLSGSGVNAYRVVVVVVVVSPPACYMPLIRRYGELPWHPPASCTHPLSIFLHRILLLQDVKTYFCSPLCRFATPTPILRSASPPLSLTSLPVLLATSLQQDVCRRLILGYNRWYFLPLSHPSTHTLLSLFCNVMSILLTC